MDPFFLWASLLLITFTSRWWPRLLRAETRTGDIYYHLLCAENIREHGFKVPPRHPRFILPGEYTYPPAYHYILALFPKDTRERFERVSSALFDTVLVALFVWVAVEWLRWDAISIFLFGLSFSLSPAFVGVGTGPRAYEGTPRTLGELLTAAAFVALWKYWMSGGLGWITAAVSLGGLVLNTSKFSGQVLLFFSWLMAFQLASLELLAFPVLCVVMAIILSKGHYWRVLKGQVAHLRLYYKKIADSHPTTLIRKKRVWLKKLAHMMLMRFGIVLIAVALVVWNIATNQPVQVDPFFVAWLLAASFVFAVVCIPAFVFLGEADRYLEYAVVPAFLIFASFCGPSYRDFVLFIILICHCALYFVNVRRFRLEYQQFKSAPLSELMRSFKQTEPSVVLSLLGRAPFEIAYRSDGSGHRVCWSESLALSEQEYERFFWRYPLPRPDFKYYVEKYGVGLIAVSKRIVKHCRNQGCVYDFTGLQVVFENDEYALYRVPKEISLAGSQRDSVG